MDIFHKINSNFSIFFKTLVQTAKKIRKQVKKDFSNGKQDNSLDNLFLQFKRLIPDLDVAQFADLYAQTLAYSLFTLKFSQKNQNAIKNLSTLNPELGTLFEAILRTRDVESFDNILQDMQWPTTKNPIIYFYEHFLKEYNPKQKKIKGVFYTPAPIVSFIIRSVDQLLRTEFDCPDGLTETSASPKIQILDPATGTGTFLFQVIDTIKRTFDNKYPHLDENDLKKSWNDYVTTSLLTNLRGFELMLVPYLVAHLKLGLLLTETGYEFKSNARSNIHLQNALENLSILKQGIPIVVGNPPYGINSISDTPYIRELMRTYKEDVKQEKYIKPLSDDYIKFIRLAHHLIETTGYGAVGMITNHGYLSGLIHRGMRNKLLQFFDKIYILDLHGNSNIRETCPDGSVDQNVFDIQQGVVISFFIKFASDSPQKGIFHLDLWGKRQSKYQFLLKNEISTLKWNRLDPNPPNFFFIPHDSRLIEEYNSYPSLKDLFKLQRIGILTNRDWLTIDFTHEALKEKIERFFALLDTPELLQTFPQLVDTWWDYGKLKQVSINTVIHSIKPCLFRPFDIRYITYHPLLLNRARKEIMDHIVDKENLVLIVSRHSRKEAFNSCFVSELIVEQKAGESTRGSYVFPLYSYSNGRRYSNLTPLGKHCFANLNPESDELAAIGYIYAILHSQSYRERYQEYLKLDFPRIPITNDKTLFLKLQELGQKLISVHLLKHPAPPDLQFHGSGTNIIQSGFPKYKGDCVYVNKTQWFQGVSQEIWSFLIGGYQICQKWLKDRKGRKLNDEDLRHFKRIISAIIETQSLTKKIDSAIETHGGWASF